MPLNALRFQPPQGLLRPDMFPGEDLGTRIDGYLAEAADKVAALPPADAEKASTAWVYYRGFSAYHAALLSTPATTTLADQGTVAWSAAQIDRIAELAARYLEEFNGVLEVEPSARETAPSGAVRTQVRW